MPERNLSDIQKALVALQAGTINASRISPTREGHSGYSEVNEASERAFDAMVDDTGTFLTFLEMLIQDRIAEALAEDRKKRAAVTGRAYLVAAYGEEYIADIEKSAGNALGGD
jgi:hypothetical protein